jgi:hypothetical protein
MTVTVEALLAVTVNVEVLPGAIDVGFAVMMIVGPVGGVGLVGGTPSPLVVPHPESSTRQDSEKVMIATMTTREARHAPRKGNMAISPSGPSSISALNHLRGIGNFEIVSAARSCPRHIVCSTPLSSGFLSY